MTEHVHGLSLRPTVTVCVCLVSRCVCWSVCTRPGSHQGPHGHETEVNKPRRAGWGWRRGRRWARSLHAVRIHPHHIHTHTPPDVKLDAARQLDALSSLTQLLHHVCLFSDEIPSRFSPQLSVKLLRRLFQSRDSSERRARPEALRHTHIMCWVKLGKCLQTSQ